jgi:hypothetical protein
VCSILLAIFWCAHVSYFSILVQLFEVDCDFFTHDVRQKDRLSSFAKRSEKNKEDYNFRDKNANDQKNGSWREMFYCL